MNDTDLAYIAGLFDGEGCIHWAKVRGYRYPHASIQMTTTGGLTLVVDLFGGQLSKHQDRRGHKDTYRWTAANRKALSFLKAIRPWLKEKAEQADKVFQFYSGIINRFCPGCGAKLEEERKRDSVYCSNSCYQKHWRSSKDEEWKERNRVRIRKYQQRKRASLKSEIEALQGTVAASAAVQDSHSGRGAG